MNAYYAVTDTGGRVGDAYLGGSGCNNTDSSPAANLPDAGIANDSSVSSDTATEESGVVDVGNTEDSGEQGTADSPPINFSKGGADVTGVATGYRTSDI